MYCSPMPDDIAGYLDSLNPNDKISLATGLLNQADQQNGESKQKPQLPLWGVLKRE